MALEQGKKLTAAEKMARIPVKIEPTVTPLRKPDWIRVRSPATPEVARLKSVLRENRLHTVCEEASCPNLGECFGKGTATFMIMGDICTRRCTFCDVAHGRPNPLDAEEPVNLAKTIEAMGLRYVVITSVDRDDLLDGGAGHFVACIREIRARTPRTQIEILVPDFRRYKQVRPGSDYQHSLNLLQAFKAAHPEVPTKSGIMVGVGEELAEVEQVLRDLRAHAVDMLTVGQYLQPSRHHLPVTRYLDPAEFKAVETLGYELGFKHVASGPLVRSSYHADQQAHDLVAQRVAGA